MLCVTFKSHLGLHRYDAWTPFPEKCLSARPMMNENLSLNGWMGFPPLYEAGFVFVLTAWKMDS